jgi:VanZ family protein
VKQNKRFLRLWIPLFVYMSFMWFLSSRSVSLPSYFLKIPLLDKVFHFLEYLVFGFLLTRAVSRRTQPETRFRLGITVVIVALIWGAIDELHQAFVPLREASFFDLIADCLGAVVGQFFYSIKS